MIYLYFHAKFKSLFLEAGSFTDIAVNSKSWRSFPQLALL